MATVAKKPAATAVNTPQKRANDMLLEYASHELAKQQLREQIKGVEQNQADLKAKLYQWALDNAREFEGKQSLKLDGGDILFKKEGERIVWDLEKAPADYEARLLKLMEAECPEAVEAVVNKKSLLNAYGLLPLLRKKLEKLGASVRNDDVFTIILKRK